MPHIVVEASPPLLAAIDWPQTLRTLHRALADSGSAALGDLKSRVQPIVAELCGDEPGAQQLIATLVLTNPRASEVSQRMADTAFTVLSRAVEALSPGQWVQCCVFLREHPKATYWKQQWNPPSNPHHP